MKNINKLIEKLCPDGVEYRPLWSLTAWDKRFVGIDKLKQKKVISYKYYFSSSFDKVERENGDIKYISTGISEKERYTTKELAKDYLSEGEIVCIPGGGTPNVKYHKGRFVTGDNRIATSLDINILNNKFLYYCMKSNIELIASFYRGTAIKHPDMKNILNICIPVPPIEVQCEIIRILNRYTKIEIEIKEKIGEELKKREEQYKYYRDKLFDFDRKVKYYELKELCKQIKDGMHNLPKENSSSGEFPILSAKNINNGKIDFETKRYVSQKEYEKERRRINIEKNDVLLTIVATIGRTAVIKEDEKILLQRSVCVLKPKEKILSDYLKYYLDTDIVQKYMIENAHGSAQAGLYLNQVSCIQIPLPPLEVQTNIVKKLKEFDKTHNYILDMLFAEMEKRQKQYEYYRDKLLSFKQLEI